MGSIYKHSCGYKTEKHVKKVKHTAWEQWSVYVTESDASLIPPQQKCQKGRNLACIYQTVCPVVRWRSV